MGSPAPQTPTARLDATTRSRRHGPFLLAARWRAYLSRPAGRIELAVTALMFGAVLLAVPRFLAWNETRAGVVLADPILARLPVLDVSWPIFVIFYGGLTLALMDLVPRPWRLLAGLRAYALLMTFRMIGMWVTPLSPDPSNIPLRDPFVELIASGGQVFTKDLFFSGHTSTAALFALVALHPLRKRVLYAGTVLVGLLVLLQAVHYSVDVFAAPFFALGAWRLGKSWPAEQPGRTE